MYQVIDKFAVGSSYAVSLKGDAALLKNGIKLIDENGQIFEIAGVVMMHYQNDKSILNSDQIEVLFKGNIEQIEKIGKLLRIIK